MRREAGGWELCLDTGKQIKTVIFKRRGDCSSDPDGCHDHRELTRLANGKSFKEPDSFHE